MTYMVISDFFPRVQL